MKYGEMTTDELELLLPLEFQRNEIRERVCGAQCPLEKLETIETYAQEIIRHGTGTQRRYFIFYRCLSMGSSEAYLTTKEYNTLRGALIAMCEILEKEGIINPKEGGAK
jgi:hypothetical protein